MINLTTGNAERLGVLIKRAGKLQQRLEHEDGQKHYRIRDMLTEVNTEAYNLLLFPAASGSLFSNQLKYRL